MGIMEAVERFKQMGVDWILVLEEASFFIENLTDFDSQTFSVFEYLDSRYERMQIVKLRVRVYGSNFSNVKIL